MMIKSISAVPNNAYQQAPWRSTIRMFSLFMLLMVVLVTMFFFFSSIKAEAAEASASLRSREYEREELQRKIVDKRAQLGQLTSSIVMENRAKDLKFEMISPDKTVYLNVPGYVGRQIVKLAPPPARIQFEAPLIKPAYTQSLWEYLVQNGFLIGMPGVRK
jgi:uncharacterized protein YpmS